MTDEKAREVILAFGAVAIFREMRDEAVILASLPKPLPRNPRPGRHQGRLFRRARLRRRRWPERGAGGGGAPGGATSLSRVPRLPIIFLLSAFATGAF